MGVSTPPSINSVLVLDDNQTNLRLVADMLSHRLSGNVVQTRFPAQAVRLAMEHFFDLIFVDVTVDYRGSPFGGLDVYGELLPRYGSEAIIAYSEVVTDNMLKSYPFVDNFVDKHVDPVVFAEKLVECGVGLREKQSCFIAMPFAAKYEPLHDTIRSAVVRAGFSPVRVDQQEFTAPIVERIFWEIRRSKVVLFVATDKNPNAFYECGYAIALRKEVVTITDEFANLPFDLRDRNALSYEASMHGLSESLHRRLTGLTRAR
jgi:CheY-like chemotaxis protein